MLKKSPENTDGRTDGRTDRRADGHCHGIIRPFFKRAYKNERPFKISDYLYIEVLSVSSVIALIR